MANNTDRKLQEEDGGEERKIPVFTVTKNGAILKNIFVIGSASPAPTSNENDFDQEETEEILTVGRHPDCNIVLMHPSISRFHLQINSKPSSQKLFVTDLSSVHGTWVSEKKIEPGCRVELNEGDEVRVGGSTRVYTLHWVPLSRAYDMENPFISPSGVAMIEDGEDQNALVEDQNRVKIMSQDLLATDIEHTEEKDSLPLVEKEEEVFQDMNSISAADGEFQSWDSELGLCFYSYGDFGSTVKKEIPSAPAQDLLATDIKHTEEDSLLLAEKEEEAFQDMNSISAADGEFQSWDSELGVCFYSYGDFGSTVKKEMPSAPVQDLLATDIKHTEEEDSLLLAEKEEEAFQDMNSISAAEGEFQSWDSELGLCFYSYGDFGSTVKKEIPSAPVQDLLATDIKHTEEEDSLLLAEKEEEAFQDMNSISAADGECQSSELGVCFYSDGDFGSIAKKEMPSAPLLPAMCLSFYDETGDVENPSSNSDDVRDMSNLQTVEGVVLEAKSQQFEEQNQSPQYHSVEEVLLGRDRMERSIIRSESESSVVLNLGHSLSNKEVEDTKSQKLEEHNWNTVCHSIEEKLLSNIREQGSNDELNLACLLSTGEVEATMNQEFEEHNQSLVCQSVVGILPRNDNREISMITMGQETNVDVNLGSSLYDTELEAQVATEILEEKVTGRSLWKDQEQTETLAAVDPIYEGDVESSPEIRTSKILVSLNNDCADGLVAINIIEEVYHQSSSSKGHELSKIASVCSEPLATESMNLPLPAAEIFSEIVDSKECSMPHSEFTLTESKEDMKEQTETLPAVNLLYEGDVESSSEIQTSKILVSLNNDCAEDLEAINIIEEVNHQSSSSKGHKLSKIANVCSEPLAIESVNSPSPAAEIFPEIVASKECSMPHSAFTLTESKEDMKGFSNREEKRLNLHSIWSRRGKPATTLQLQTSRSRGKSIMADTDCDVEWENHEDIESRPFTRLLFSGSEAAVEEFLTPDMENYTPNTLPFTSPTKNSKLEDILIAESCRLSSSTLAFSQKIMLEDDIIASSDKENQTPKIHQEMKSATSMSKNQLKLEQETVLKERRAERMPLQSILLNSPVKSISRLSFSNSAAKRDSSLNSIQDLQKKITSSRNARTRWTMVADTTSLLDKESRKSLQLLQGVKGTHLIIPRMVIRELDCLKQRGSLFRRTTEASLVLEWIEGCMAKTKWWIHVQSSVEMEKPIAQTPPASPHSLFDEGSGVCPSRTTSSVLYTTYWNFSVTLSPTAEDHLLDCALQYRKMNNDGQLVLLSNDITLKIKSMAEGLLCETAQEFRNSLVNPFSERFLWANSSPRGRTWSVLDDVVLKENYYRSPSKKSFKGEGAKGLKLILLHNSHYGHTNQSVRTM